ncbi:MAG: hypothetical protein ACKVY0_01875 [Prosthecobacter sp.]|uniref:hypothetical protein n=1 Tax=Prosthecobacter sp. TaxID=1965333 RepID=UPI00390207E4
MLRTINTSTSTSTFLLLCCLLIPSGASAYLGGFEVADGYATSDVGTALAHYPPFLGRYVGPEVQLYNAGATGTLSDIADNTGLWRNIYGAGTQGRYKLWDASSNADATYLSGHFNPYGSGGLLAIRASENRLDQGQNYGVTGAFNAQWTYSVDSDDLKGINPFAIGEQDVSLSFQLAVGAQFRQPVQGGAQLSFVDNQQVMLAIGIGGDYTQSAVNIGIDDLQHVRYYANSTWVDTGVLASHDSFDNVQLTMHFADQTFDLMYGSALDGLLHPLVTRAAFATPLAGAFGNITLTTYTDPEGAGSSDDHGLGKSYLDTFDFTVTVPEPGSALLSLCALLVLCAQRRRK